MMMDRSLYVHFLGGRRKCHSYMALIEKWKDEDQGKVK